MITVYIKGNSKAAINRDLEAGKAITATEYSFGIMTHDFADLPEGTCVKVYSKMIGGNPYAKSYGTVKKGRLS
jgi:hypothetical protein